MPPVRREVVEQLQESHNIGLVPAGLNPTGEVIDYADNDIRYIAISGIAEIVADPVALASTRRHLTALSNVEEMVRGRKGESQLRPHQEDVFDDIYEFLKSPPTDENGFVQRGYIELPTGSGKTVIFAKLAEVIGKAGRDANGHKLRSLVLVPKLDLLHQTVGNDERGFKRFAPDVDVTQYYSGEKDLSGETVVMTYQSLTRAMDKGVVTPGMFDLVICDEAHTVIAGKRKEAVATLLEGSLGLALTATPDYKSKDETRHVNSLFPYEIHNVGLREAIERGFLSPVRAIAIKSDEVIDSISAGDFNEEELRGLAHSEWRNMKGVEFAKAFVENGERGVVSCVPGDDCEHAYTMAELISNQTIVDSDSGEERKIKAVAVDGTMPANRRKDIYAQFDAGKIDVLTYVDLLTEGWDSEEASFIVNLRPTTSFVNATQRIGRVLRRSPNKDVATVVEIIDESNKGQVTFYHVFGEEEINHGKTLGPKEPKDEDFDPVEDTYTDEQLDLILPDDIKALIAQINHVNIGELVVMPREYLEAPDGHVSLIAFARNNHVDRKRIIAICEEMGIEPSVHKFGTTPGASLDPSQQEQILGHTIFGTEIAPEVVLSTIRAAQRLNVDKKTLEQVAERLGVTLDTYRFGSRYALGITAEQVELIKGQPEFQPVERSIGIMTVRAFARNNNLNPRSIAKAAGELGLSIDSMRVGSRFAPALTPEQQQAVLGALGADKPDEGVISLSRFAEANALQMKDARALVEELGIEPQTFMFKNRRAPGLTAAQQELVLDKIGGQHAEPTEGAVSLSAFCNEHGINYEKAKQTLQEAGHEIESFNFGGKRVKSLALTPDQQEFLVGGKVEKAPEGYLSRDAFSSESGLSYRRVAKAVEELGLDLKKYRFGVKSVTGLSPQEQATIREYLS